MSAIPARRRSPIPRIFSGTYAFLPWLRQGVANAITAAPASGARASIHVELDLTGNPVGGRRRAHAGHRAGRFAVRAGRYSRA